MNCWSRHGASGCCRRAIILGRRSLHHVARVGDRRNRKSERRCFVSIGRARWRPAADFLGWRGRRRARVMYLDGELPRRDVQGAHRTHRRPLRRRREGVRIQPRRSKKADDMPPLNTEAGRAWLWREIEAAKPDVIFFNAVMCLLIGKMGEEDSSGADQGPCSPDFISPHRSNLVAPYRPRCVEELRNQNPRMGNGHRHDALENRGGKR